MQHYIYFMISVTQTRFGYLIRKVGHNTYNHTSVILDDQFKEIYGFARSKHKLPFVGGLVKENVDRFTLKRNVKVPVKIFRVPVNVVEYEGVRKIIKEIYEDEEYMYNLYSVLSFPLLQGFETYKAYSCIEFIVHLLQYLQFNIDKPAFQYKPDDLVELLKGYEYYTGDLVELLPDSDPDLNYFEPINLGMVKENMVHLKKITQRTFLNRQ